MQKILAIDDKMDNLVTLTAMLKNLMPDYAVITAQSGMEGIRKARAELPDVILLDVKMPDVNGFETCCRLMSDEMTKHIPVIMITAIKTEQQSRIKGLDIGANAFLAKPIDEYELVSQLNVALRIKKAEDALREERDALEKTVQERTSHLVQEITERKRTEEALRNSEDKYRRIIETSKEGIVIHDENFLYTFVNKRFAEMLGYSPDELIGTDMISFTFEEDMPQVLERRKRRRQGNLEPFERRFRRKDGSTLWTLVSMTSIIHDIGKMSVPAEILSKPTRLTVVEMNLIKIHSQAGYDILKEAELPYPIAEIILQHHERLDGSGYPQGLKNGQIFLEAQIVAVADVVEAIASHRPYRPALGIGAALEEIEKNKGILYDEKVVEACLKLFREKGFSFEYGREGGMGVSECVGM